MNISRKKAYIQQTAFRVPPLGGDGGFSRADRGADRIANQIEDECAAHKADFGFLRVNVHVDAIERQCAPRSASTRLKSCDAPSSTRPALSR